MSLAAFQENPQDVGNDGNYDSDEIEQGILKQLFYSVDHKSIPQSRYRKLHRIGYVSTMIGIGAIGLMIALLLFVFIPDKFLMFSGLITEAGSRCGLTPIKTVIATIVVFLFIDYIMSKLYRNLLGKIRIKEVKLTENTTIASENEGDNSVFNRNLDEIVYYFEEMKYDIVFFEDLDRLNNAKIFVKLRELNILLNNDNAIKRPVKFVYAVRDDIFTDSDRTKFFEFIIPIVPVINSTNSGEILANLVKDGPMHPNISEEYILDISPYVSDMRLLQNAYNEFLIYKRTLQSGQSLNLEDQAMLSLVIFKNLYPKEFTDLQAEKGVVKQAFVDKSKVIVEIQKKMQEEIDAATELLEGLHNDCLENRRELVTSFFCAVTDWKGYAYDITINGQSYRFSTFMDTEFDFEHIYNRCREIEYVSGSYLEFSGYTYNFRTPITKDFFASYAKRFKSLTLEEDNKSDVLRKKIEDKQQRIYSIGGFSLKKLIEEYGVELVLSENIRAIKPLVYMLRMGYIDERYSDYINYFKGTSITTADMNFILSVKNHEPLPFNYKLTKVDQVVARLQPYEFEQEAIRNFDLLEFLLGVEIHNEKRRRFIKKIADGSESSWQFLDEFAEKTAHVQKLFQDVVATWPEMWDYVATNVVLTRERKNYYLAKILSYADLQFIIPLDENQKLSAYFVENTSILEALSDVPIEKMIAVINALGIRFVDVDLKNGEKKVAEHIIDEACYEVCQTMIYRITEYLNSDLLKSLEKKNYSTLFLLNSPQVLNHVDDDWDKYIDEIVLAESNTEEEAKVVVKLIEKTLPNIDTCVKLITHQNFKLNSLEVCYFDEQLKEKRDIAALWNQLLIEDKISSSWNNVMLYWNYLGLTEKLLDFVERHATQLVNEDVSDVDEGFIRDYLCSSGDEDAYRLLTKKLKLEEFDLQISDIPEERVDVMIENRYFDFSVDIYSQIRSAYPGLSIKAILFNQKECIALINSIEINPTLLSELIQHNEINEDLKESLLKKFGVSYMSENLAMELCRHQYSIEKQVFWKAWNNLNEINKKKLMYNYLSMLTDQDFERCFADINDFVNLRNRVRHNVDLEYNENNELLAKRLEKLQYITSWRVDNRAHKIICGKETRTENNNVIVCVVKTKK